jgi:hypothetical protein
MNLNKKLSQNFNQLLNFFSYSIIFNIMDNGIFLIIIVNDKMYIFMLYRFTATFHENGSHSWAAWLFLLNSRKTVDYFSRDQWDPYY